MRKFHWTLFTALAALTVLSSTTVFSDGGAEHQLMQPRPIPLGVSGGSILDQDGQYCCAGTLGALVQDTSGNLFILSNNHVLARYNRASIGEPIVQPGRIEVGCAVLEDDVVADLADFVRINRNLFNQVDAAIALVRPGAVDPTGQILDIGPLNADILAPTLGLAVKKSGRTSGLTHGLVEAVDVTIIVGYPRRCSPDGSVDSIFFTNVFRVGPGFSAAGDSGSVVVEDTATEPRAVGLLFAGAQDGTTFANRIDLVLEALDVSMVGDTGPAPPPPPPPATGTIAGVVTSNLDGSGIGGALVEVDSGPSAVTLGDGSYQINDVPIGDYTLTATATGYLSVNQAMSVSENQTTTANFALDPLVIASNAMVNCFIYSTEGGRNGDKHLLLTVTIVDDMGFPVPGALVSVELTYPNGKLGHGENTTDGLGAAAFIARNARDGCYSARVTNVVAPGLGFSGTQPPNGFQKGVDLTPEADCLFWYTECGTPALTGNPAPPPHARLGSAIKAKRRHETHLLGMPGVVGVGVSQDSDGQPFIEVYLDAPGRGGIPQQLDGVSVKSVVTGEVIAH